MLLPCACAAAVPEKRAISPEMAVLLSAYFGTSDGYWINLQARFDLEMAKDKVGKVVSQPPKKLLPATGV
jgi:plasmid maintenance system antidote protein VapI